MSKHFVFGMKSEPHWFFC